LMKTNLARVKLIRGGLGLDWTWKTDILLRRRTIL
jgi:hypothetical protein